MDDYVGEVKMFAGTFAPVYWEFCWGQLLQVSEYSTLFAIIGTTFGGDGINNFALPDLRARIPIGSGQGPGLSQRAPGQMGGAENVTLETANLPQHSHTVKCDITGTKVNTPVNNFPADTSVGKGYATNPATFGTMSTNMTSNAGSSQPHDNMPPWGCINYIICVEGVWPPRP